MRAAARGALLIASSLLLAACGGGSSSTATIAGGASAPAASTASAAAPGAATGADGCDHAAPPPAHPKRYAAPPAPRVTSGPAAIVLATSCGPLTFAVDWTLGGAVASAVAGLVDAGFYDGLTFHRVVPGFVLQGGDPEGTGAGGPGFSVVQAPPAGYHYRPGDLAMAKTGAEPAGTAGSQFFVVSSAAGARALAQPGQPPLYAVVGHATDAASLATIGRIDALGRGDGPPSKPVYILKATLRGG
jgi:cyclophilin family peptidyl-prolyl cis-trans isomerase